MSVRVRIPPSPTGLMHVGTLRGVLWNWLYARRFGGKFILRLEDTDQSRSVPGSYENMVRVFKRTGLEPDEGPAPFADGGVGPYIQSERLSIYKKYADELVKNGSAYVCFCSSERLDALRAEQEALKLPTKYDGHCRNLDAAEVAARVAAGESHVIRLRVPKGEKLIHNDLIRGKVEFSTSDVDDQVLMKADGFPTYHLAVVVDDYLMGITHAFRGEEWLPSMPKQILIARAIGVELPAYAHLPLILGNDRKKLSKRTGDVAVEEYLKKGYPIPALLNYIALLGWNPKTTEEFLSLEELVKRFDIVDVQKAGAIFDTEKLDWMSNKYIAKMDADIRYQEICAYLEEFENEFFTKQFNTKSEAYNRAIVQELSTRLHFYGEYKELTKFFYTEPEVDVELFVHEKMGIITPQDAKIGLEFALECLKDCPQNALLADLQTLFLEKIKTAWLKNGTVLWPVRVALSGERFSPGALELLAILPQETSKARITSALEKLKRLG